MSEALTNAEVEEILRSKMRIEDHDAKRLARALLEDRAAFKALHDRLSIIADPPLSANRKWFKNTAEDAKREAAERIKGWSEGK